MKETGPKCHGAIEDVYGILTFATIVLNFELIHLAIRVYAKHWVFDSHLLNRIFD